MLYLRPRPWPWKKEQTGLLAALRSSLMFHQPPVVFPDLWLTEAATSWFIFSVQMGCHKTWSLNQAVWTHVRCFLPHKNRYGGADLICAMESQYTETSMSHQKGKMTSESTLARLTRGTNIRWQCDEWIAEGCSATWAWRAEVPSNPAGPEEESRPCTPSIQPQREAGLHG